MNGFPSFLEAFVAFLALIATIIFGYQQREHNRSSVRPWPELITYDDDERGEFGPRIYVAIENRGTGPLIIRSIRCESQFNKARDLIDLLPDDLVIRTLKYFSRSAADNAIAADKRLILLDLRPKNEDDRRALEELLAQTTIRLRYTDIYQKLDKTKLMKLDYFSHFE